jgi:hypothetical protein
MSAESDALSAACQSLTDAICATSPDPADGIGLLVRFVGTTPAPLSFDIATAEAQHATATMIRRCALTSLAALCASYNPTSSTEALAPCATRSWP